MNSKVYIFHSDAGHGWLAVKAAELIEHSLFGEISSYSYQRGQTVYLEEDSDAPKFLSALKAKGIEYKIRQAMYRERSPIRSYARYPGN